MSERLDEVEIKLAHLELTVTELSDALYAQQQAIERLTRSNERLKQRIEALGESAEVPADEQIPPHY